MSPLPTATPALASHPFPVWYLGAWSIGRPSREGIPRIPRTSQERGVPRSIAPWLQRGGTDGTRGPVPACARRAVENGPIVNGCCN